MRTRKTQPSELSRTTARKVDVMNEKIDNIETKINDISKKLDEFAKTKADLEDLRRVERDVQGIKNWVFYSVICGVVVYAIVQGIKYIGTLVAQ